MNLNKLLGDNSAEQGMDQLRQNQDIWNQVQTPDLKWQDYKPETFNPDMMNAETINEDPALRSGQMDVLSQMAGLSRDGLSSVDEAGYNRSRQEAQQIAQGETGAALANAQSRGLSGSGMEFASREMAGQNAANRAQSADLTQNADSAKMRALYSQAYGQQLGSVRGQDYQTNAANTNILNQFNAANTQNRNAAHQWNTQNQNNAQMYNNEGRTNTQQQRFNNDVTRAGGRSQANTSMAQGYGAQDAANTSQTNTLIGAGAGLGAGYLAGRGRNGNGGSGYAHGGMIPGIPHVSGDSPLNDTVNIDASPGEIVIPRTHAHTPHLAKAFVDHLFGKK